MCPVNGRRKTRAANKSVLEAAVTNAPRTSYLTMPGVGSHATDLVPLLGPLQWSNAWPQAVCLRVQPRSLPLLYHITKAGRTSRRTGRHLVDVCKGNAPCHESKRKGDVNYAI